MTSTTSTTIKVSNETLNEFKKQKVDFMYKNGITELSNASFVARLLEKSRKNKK
jgi:hypothetical protein